MTKEWRKKKGWFKKDNWKKEENEEVKDEEEEEKREGNVAKVDAKIQESMNKAEGYFHR